MKTSNSRAVLEHKQKFISPPSPLLAENQIQTPHRSNSPNTKLHVLDFFNNGTSKQSGIKVMKKFHLSLPISYADRTTPSMVLGSHIFLLILRTLCVGCS
jgi:hypothetical protein